MNTPKLLVALQGTGKFSRAWNIANQIAEFQRAKIHALNLTRLDAANTAHDYPAKNQSEPQSPKGCLQKIFADKDADTALQGNLAQQRIYKTAREINADLVIVGTDRRTGLRRLLPSATHRLCDAIACHLLAVRSNGPVDGYRRISIAMDPSRSPIKVNENRAHVCENGNYCKVRDRNAYASEHDPPLGRYLRFTLVLDGRCCAVQKTDSI